MDDASQQMTQMMSLSGQGPGHKDSLATNDTSKQVFGQKQMMTPKMPSKAGPGRGDGSMLAGELASIKEDQGATQINGIHVKMPNADVNNLVQDDSIIEND